MVLKTYDLMIDFRTMIVVPLVLTTGMLILKKTLTELIEAPHKVEQK